MTRYRVYLLGGVFATYALFFDRLVLRLNTGGSGVVAIMNLVVVLVVFLFLVLPEAKLALGYVFEKSYWKSAGPFLALGFVLFPLGVILYGRPIRLLWGMFGHPLVMLSFISMGYWMASKGKAALKAIKVLIAFMILLESTYAILVFLQKNGTISVPILDQLAQWDRTTQAGYSVTYIVESRAIGTYINPNTLGITLGLFWCWTIASMSGIRRFLLGVVILVALYFCESRGSWFGVVASIPFVFFTSRESQGLSSFPLPHSSPVLKLCASAVVVSLVGVILFSQEGLLSERMHSGLDVFSEGARADQNLESRVNVWQAASRVLAEYPFGALGPAEMIMGSYIDSQYISYAIQGGAVLLFCYLLLLLWGIRMSRVNWREARFVALSSVFVAVNSISALPATSPGFSLYWYGVGVLYFLFRTRKR